MRALVDRAVLVVLVAGSFLAHGCCDPPREDFMIDSALSEYDVETLMVALSFQSRDQIPCDAACSLAYRAQSSYEEVEPDSCMLTIDPNPGANPETEVGRVICSGTAWAYACD